MEDLSHIIYAANVFVWGWPTIILLLGLGIYLTIGLRFVTLRKLGTSFRKLASGRYPSGVGEISPFRSLMTAMSATVGTGNIAGVATAIALGGPGAIFWMWLMALLGMATKYSEAVLAVYFRQKNEYDEYHGGPMYYIKIGISESLGPRFATVAAILAALFAIFAAFASFGIGNMVQSNSVADALNSVFNIPEWVSGSVVAGLAGLVILGGLKRIAAVAAKLVPLMTVTYVVCALSIILLNVSEVPSALYTIVYAAFNGQAAVGGFAGTAVMMAIQFGIARGIFSNEAGLGSAAIAHAAAQTNSPVSQGHIAMLGTFIDTLIICTMTGLVIVITGAWTTGLSGAAMSTAAFGGALPHGDTIISIALAVFAFTTVLGWSLYGERCLQYLFGHVITYPFRVLWIIALYVGSTQELNLLWALADTLNGLMAWPNLIGILLLSGLVFRLTRDEETREGAGLKPDSESEPS